MNGIVPLIRKNGLVCELEHSENAEFIDVVIWGAISLINDNCKVHRAFLRDVFPDMSAGEIDDERYKVGDRLIGGWNGEGEN
jgi:hypothetical protein